MQHLMAVATPVLLKSIGALFRIFSVPADTDEWKNLRKAIAKQEFSVVGLVFATSLLFNRMVNLLPKKYSANPFVQFIPQALAYVFSESVSRKMTNLKENFKNVAAPQTKLHVDAKVSADTSNRIPAIQTSNPIKRRHGDESEDQNVFYHSRPSYAYPQTTFGNVAPLSGF